MKARITSSVLIFILLNILSLKAQQFYYSAGKKNFIQADSTTIIVKTRKGADLNTLQRALISTPNFKRFHKFKNSELVEIKFEKPVALNEVNIQGIERVMYGYKMGDNPLYLTGEILLMPKDGVDITQIMELCQNKIHVITAKSMSCRKYWN